MMPAPVFDGITRVLGVGERSSRRGFLRLLDGAAAVGATIATGHAETAARKKGS